MKNSTLLFAAITLFAFSCNQSENKGTSEEMTVIDAQYDYFGDTITYLNTAIGLETFETLMEENGTLEETMISGTVAEVCQAKGCWMNLDLPNGSMMKVKFKDYAFFVPKDIAGKEIVIKGAAALDTTTVEELRHYAEDAGKSEEEIAAINEPEIGYKFLASGVAVKK